MSAAWSPPGGARHEFSVRPRQETHDPPLHFCAENIVADGGRQAGRRLPVHTEVRWNVVFTGFSRLWFCGAAAGWRKSRWFAVRSSRPREDSVLFVSRLEVLLRQSGDPRLHFRGELLHDFGMLRGEVLRLGGVGGDVVEFKFAAVFARGVAQFPLAFADVGFAAGCAGFPEQRFGADVRGLAEPRGGGVLAFEIGRVDLRAGGSAEVVFFLGQTENKEMARAIKAAPSAAFDIVDAVGLGLVALGRL